MKRIFENIILVVSGVICVSINYWFSAHLSAVLAGIVSVVISSLFGVVLVFYMSEIVLNTKTMRKKTDPLAKYEGLWYHKMTIEDERAFGLFHFIYDADAKLYKYTGRDYDKDGNVICACDFYDIRINDTIAGFLYTGTVNKGNSKFKNIGEFIYMEHGIGNGSFSNIGSESSINGSYLAYRITNEDVEKLIGKKHIYGSDYDKLALECYKNHLQ